MLDRLIFESLPRPTKGAEIPTTFWEKTKKFIQINTFQFQKPQSLSREQHLKWIRENKMPPLTKIIKEQTDISFNETNSFAENERQTLPDIINNHYLLNPMAAFAADADSPLSIIRYEATKDMKVRYTLMYQLYYKFASTKIDGEIIQEIFNDKEFQIACLNAWVWFTKNCDEWKVPKGRLDAAMLNTNPKQCTILIEALMKAAQKILRSKNDSDTYDLLVDNYILNWSPSDGCTYIRPSNWSKMLLMFEASLAAFNTMSNLWYWYGFSKWVAETSDSALYNSSAFLNYTNCTVPETLAVSRYEWDCSLRAVVAALSLSNFAFSWMRSQCKHQRQVKPIDFSAVLSQITIATLSASSPEKGVDIMVCLFGAASLLHAFNAIRQRHRSVHDGFVTATMTVNVVAITGFFCLPWMQQEDEVIYDFFNTSVVPQSRALTLQALRSVVSRNIGNAGFMLSMVIRDNLLLEKLEQIVPELKRCMNILTEAERQIMKEKQDLVRQKRSESRWFCSGASGITSFVSVTTLCGVGGVAITAYTGGVAGLPLLALCGGLGTAAGGVGFTTTYGVDAVAESGGETWNKVHTAGGETWDKARKALNDYFF
jgi:hypothetical protein